MKTLSLRPVRRFLRGLSGQMRVALCVILAAVLLLASFGIYLLVRPDNTTDTSAKTIFPSVDRAGIVSIRIHTDSGAEYTVQSRKDTVTGTDGNPITTKSFYLVTGDGVARPMLTINSMQLSNLVVGTGSNYVYEAVVSLPADADAATGAAYADKLAELGFSDDSPYYELTTEGGEVYRVLYGMKNITGEGYYVKLADEDVVYASKTAFVGDLLQLDGPETLIEPTLIFPSLNTYAYAFEKDFTVRDYERVDERGTAVSETDYGVGYTLQKADGTTATGSYTLQPFEGESAASAAYRTAMRTFFVGKTLGECNEKFTFTYPDTEDMGELRGQSYEVQFVSIDYVTREELRFSVSYLFYEVSCPYCGTMNYFSMAEDRENLVCTNCGKQVEDSRDLSHKYSVYGFTAPADMTNYIPGFDATATMFQNMMEVTGTVVKLGVDDATMTKYGLYRHQVSFSYPYNDVTDFDTYVSAFLYISAETENGTRYVADPLLYDLVVEVDASTLSFLDDDSLAFVDDYVFPTAAEDVTMMQMFWNYGEGKWTNTPYNFEITFGVKENVSGEAYHAITAVTATPVGGGESIPLDPDAYTMLYSRLTYTRYKGGHGLSDEQVSAMIADAENTCVLRIVMSTSSGAANIFEFYPISANRVAVRVKVGAGSAMSCRFVIYRTALDDIVRAYERLMEGESFDFEDRYE